MRSGGMKEEGGKGSFEGKKEKQRQTEREKGVNI